MSADNLRHWNALCRTDPSHTKPFQRAGGFKGTAIKPIFMTQMMTAHFGPCGVGWGMDRPEFTTLTVGDEILVYCTVQVWYDEAGKARAGVVYGVGGDKVATKRRDGTVATDDEAFKKAYTDALSNALKQIGVGADVHMGMFEDAKYVNELRREFADDDAPAPSQRPTASAKPPAPPADDPEAIKAEARAFAARLKASKTVVALHQVMDDGRDLLKKVPEDIYKVLNKIYDDKLTAMETPS